MGGSDSSNPGELFLIDGNSMAYRAFFALPDSMSTADGRPTNAIFGLASMLAKLITDYDPAQVVVAWDAGMSGRDEIYPEYKAQRPPKPDLLREQWPELVRMVEAFGYTNVRVDGFEADDVLASLATEAGRRGIPAVVVTGDRDAYQLVGDGIRVMSTSRGVTDVKMFDREAVKEKYGVYPELVTDFMGLRGDTSDNIPGVPGVGEKTAAALIEQFGSLDEVLANVDQVSGPKRRQNLTEHADDARLSRRLATMDREVETGVDLADVMAAEPDRSGLRDFMHEFELRAVLRRIEGALGSTGSGPATGDETAREPVELDPGGLASLADGPVAVGYGGGWAATDGERVVAGEGSPADLAAGLGGRPLLGHDLKSVGGRPGLLDAFADAGRAPALEHDTMVAAYLLEPTRRSYDLDVLAEAAGLEPVGTGGDEGQLSLDMDDGEDRVPPELVTTVWELAELQRPRLAESGLEHLFNDIEMPLVTVLADMERAGIKLDRDKIAAMASGMDEQIATLESRIHELAGHDFTIGSPQQVAQVLFEELDLPPKRRGKTGFSTDARVLAQLRDQHEIVGLIEHWRELTKLKNTYLVPLPETINPETGRIHTTFVQTAVPTGRISSVHPNLQAIPVRSENGRPLRGCFVAEAGNQLISADYSQVELRVLAHAADEEVLKSFFRAGGDVHAATAAQVFGIEPDEVDEATRSKAKMVNFGIMYGLTGFGLADRLNIPRAEGDEFVKRYLERFPAVRDFRERVVEEALEQGYVSTLLGRRRPLPELRSGQANTRRLGERLAINSVIQGTAADIIKIAMIRCRKALAEEGLEGRLILQIHDELLFECPDGEVDRVIELARREMVAAFDLDPPLEVEVGAGSDWLNAK